MTDDEWPMELRQIILNIILIAAFIILALALQTDPPKEDPSEAEKVASYKNCEIIRWTDPSSRYQYFLHCSQ